MSRTPYKTSIDLLSSGLFWILRTCVLWPPAVESSIAVEDAVENHGLYRVLVSCIWGFGHKSTTIARLSPLSGLERGG